MPTSLTTLLGRPAFHITLTLGFAVAFFWPIFAMARPSQVFHFLYGAWFVCLVALFAVSRGSLGEATEEGGDGEGEGEQRADDKGLVGREVR